LESFSWQNTDNTVVLYYSEFTIIIDNYRSSIGIDGNSSISHRYLSVTTLI